MNTNILSHVRASLKKSINEKSKVSFPRFFKEEIKFYGVNTWDVGKISKETLKRLMTMDKKEVFALCEDLFASGYCEKSWIAASWAHAFHKQFKPEDFETFKLWVEKYVNNWATCDTFCNHTMGTFIEMYPEYLKELKKWTRSNNRWVKRASAVSLIVPAKRGMFLDDVFEIADMLLTDKDDMVQKGYGWLLKVASQVHQKEVFDYVVKQKAIMPRTALRYAIEKMPQELRKKAMEK